MTRSMAIQLRNILVAGALVAFGAAACSNGDGSTATSAEAETTASLGATSLRPGDAVPAPTGEAVLTVTGLVDDSGNDRSISFDQATLDRLGLKRFTVYEPYVKQELGFQGVRLDDLLAVVEPQSEATTLHLVALDDYVVDFPISEVDNGGVFIATANADGSTIPVKDGGPIRIVFTDQSPLGEVDTNWIWSLATLEVQ